MEFNLKDLVNIKYGKNQKNVKNPRGEYPILGTGGIMDYADDFLYDKPSVLIGRKGSIGKVKYIEEPFWTIDTLFYTIVNENLVIPKYLYYKLSQIDFNYYNEGTTIPSLRTETLYKIDIDLPKKNIQKKVVNLLNTIDEKIENNQKIIANLEELSQTLFKRWFVDFEFPDENENPYKSSGGKMIDSELGEMPELWSVKNINELLKIYSGYAFKSKWWSDDGYNVIKIKDINNNSIDITGLDKVNEIYVEKASNFKVYGGEILIALTGATAGKLGIVPKLKELAFVNQRVGLITSNIDNVYIYHLLKSDRIRRLTLDQAIGSAQANISPVKFGSIKILWADEKTIDRYCQLTRSNYEKIVELYSENNDLIQLRDTLLPKLMSGEIEIPDDIEVNEDELSI
ncbi:restriction endonuclease subunit S [Staphylococcus equorum]|uniref:restriction endonuclease subunit S n=1 Tax=Staphylococcus equorum TaxID=246432 RepID=UPI0008528F03|nr:restriction endonuclease subunit S [Staphylococcus equorum]OEK75259.1 type I restriction endonuclease subunit S [Staphylococcus equorum]